MGRTAAKSQSVESPQLALEAPTVRPIYDVSADAKPSFRPVEERPDCTVVEKPRNCCLS